MIYDLTETGTLKDFESIRHFSRPDSCPVCHVGILAVPVLGYDVGGSPFITVVYLCPKCKELFVVKYRAVSQGHNYLRFEQLETYPMTIEGRTFSDHIAVLSPSFVNIYNQAREAELRRLEQICGVGYRKALEFLIKDYVLKVHAEEGDTAKVTRGNLAWVIKEYIEHKRIKELAERAVWLGNDETHYERLWNDKDITDLKTLIELVVRYIDMEFIADQYVADMPSGKK